MTETKKKYKTFDSKEVRKDFALFNQSNLAYLDNAATTQRPNQVLEAEMNFYQRKNANPFRGIYDLSVEATDAYEEARKKVANLIHAKEAEEIVFTRNASESLNLVAYSLGELVLREGDEILVGITEHHSNMLPWRQAAKRKGAKVNYLYTDEKGEITEEAFTKALSQRTKIVALTQVSNVFGRLNDLKTFAEIAHQRGIYFVADGAQSIPHRMVDVSDLGVDFLAFSGHKMLASMGIGVLYGKKELLEAMPPFLTGGEMIETVSLEKITYAPVPHKFEAGTVNTGGAVSLSAAIDYLNQYGMENLARVEEELTVYAYEKMERIPGIRILGSDDPRDHHGILTFQLEGVHPHDIAYILNQDGVAVRAGHHCAQPLLKYLKTPSTTRASLYFYNTKDEVDRLIDGLSKIRREMGYLD